MTSHDEGGYSCAIFWDMSTGTLIIFYLCKRRRKGANKCDLKPRKGHKCTHFGKICHKLDGCWEKQASITKRVLFDTVEEIKGDRTEGYVRMFVRNEGVVIDGKNDHLIVINETK